MFLHLISEKDLRLRIKNGWAEVFFRKQPELVLGRRAVEGEEDLEHFDEAWERIINIIGPFMPADLIEDNYSRFFDGIAYLSYGFSCCNCPNCKNELTRDNVLLKTRLYRTYINCPFCRSKIKVKIWDKIPKKIK